MIGEKLFLTTLPRELTSVPWRVLFEDPGGDALLRFEFERDGVKHRGGLEFHKARAFRFRNEGHCTLWHVEGVYDTLAEVTDSEWVLELLAADSTGRWEIHHYMIYVEDVGCYEVGAESWSWLPDEPLP